MGTREVSSQKSGRYIGGSTHVWIIFWGKSNSNNNPPIQLRCSAATEIGQSHTPGDTKLMAFNGFKVTKIGEKHCIAFHPKRERGIIKPSYNNNTQHFI